MNHKIARFLLVLSSALLLSVAWYLNLSVIIFFAFVPLLVVEAQISADNKSTKSLRLFGFSYLCFLVWNILVTWWIVYASFGGACMAFIFNALLMSLVFVFYAKLKHVIQKPWSVWLLIPLWVAWEHIHTLWDITWPWLTLGNVFAFNHQWIQWYEFTGTSGGTAWVLAVNILIFITLRNNNVKQIFSKPVGRIASLIIFPILISYMIYFFRATNVPSKETSVVVVQPNIDPYSEKFYVAYEEQFNKMLRLVKDKITKNTDYLVLPETFITGISDDLNEEALNSYLEIEWFRDSLIRKYPNLKIVTGANTFRNYYKQEEVTSTSRKSRRTGIPYDMFNSGVYITLDSCDIYHKSKLVPGVEKMPFPALLKPLESMAIDLGGTMGSLGTQDYRGVFIDKKNNTFVAPVICYESVYADFVADYVRNGANIIFIITNDGWWDDTPGYVQHLNYARLRAIENRRSIARSANTGISCFIDQVGNISNATKYWEPAVISKAITVNDDLTFFSRFGDLISYISVIISSLLVLLSLGLYFKK